MNFQNKIAAAYLRVSDERQDEFSPDSQLKLIKDYCSRNNIELPEEYIFYDDGISAKSVKKRKQFNDMIALAKQNYVHFGVEDRAKIFLGDAGEIIPVLTGEYDFIFLDGPKGHYFEYLPHLLEVLNKGGILFADNVLFRGYVGEDKKAPHRFNTTKHSMERFLSAISNDKNLKTQILDIEDGISITEKL